MRDWIVLFFFFLNSISPVLAQYVPEEKSQKDTTLIYSNTNKRFAAPPTPGQGNGFDWSKVYPGGNFAINFGTVNYLDLSPNVGYQIKEKLMLGVGITYISFWGNGNNGSFSWSIYGGRLFGRQLLFDNIYAHAELESLNVPYYLINSSEIKRKWLTSPLVGASYVFPFANRGGIQATLLYNLNYQPNYSPYPSELVWRMGFFF